jgi:hypothetical protein
MERELATSIWHVIRQDVSQTGGTLPPSGRRLRWPGEVDYCFRQIARLCSLSCKISWRKSSSPMTAVIPTKNSNWLTVFCESADSRSNERSLPIDLVRDGRARPVAGTIASRNPSSSTSAQCIIIIKRKSLKRVAVGSIGRLLFVGLYAPKCWTR